MLVLLPDGLGEVLDHGHAHLDSLPNEDGHTMNPARNASPACFRGGPVAWFSLKGFISGLYKLER
jgi:hypothetical protein